MDNVVYEKIMIISTVCVLLLFNTVMGNVLIAEEPFCMYLETWM